MNPEALFRRLREMRFILRSPDGVNAIYKRKLTVGNNVFVSVLTMTTFTFFFSNATDMGIKKDFGILRHILRYGKAN